MSTLAKVLWINLDRRTDRADAQLNALEAAGLEDFGERFSAVDGSQVDFDTVPETILTRKGREQAENPPDFVLGRVLTPGAVGLWLSWYEVMCRIMEEAAPNECFLVVEDDAEYSEDFGVQLFRLLDALDRCDELWHACAVGFIKSKSRHQELYWESERPKWAKECDEVLKVPVKLCGATAILVHGPDGAEEMLRSLFPIDADQQFDLKITMQIHDPQSTMRFYSSAVPLATAPLSEAGDTDIQRIPPEKQRQLREEAQRRHRMGDHLPCIGSEPEPPPLARVRRVRPLPWTPLQRGLGLEWCCMSVRPSQHSWPSRRPTSPGTNGCTVEISAEELELQKLRSLDKGVPELRHLHGELALKTQQLRQRPSRQVEEEYHTLQHLLQEAVEARDHILQAAIPYARRPCEQTRKALLLRKVPNGDSDLRAAAHFPSGRRKILLMGLYHSCTNAMAKELERHFDVEILNDWHTCKADANWKHRANSRRPPALAEDVFCVLMAKEPHFWLQSCSRELRNFFEIRPVGPERRELPAQELWQLLSSIEHDGVLYENAMDLWNDTMHSYLDDSVYPPHQTVIVRCEDFLFSFHGVLRALQKLGALTPKLPLETAVPLMERAKGHKECRDRDEALQFYSNPKHQKAAFNSDQLALIGFALDRKALAQLGYDEPDCVQRWVTQGL
ncbi:unnamed protein product [Cladocopium goreaui]|uniref:Uncharacterized protein n=1 Tax=Cladocopium goreaui TaxID=2562237 RepID=A0A9P1D1Y5_9DINO|nr:unnamed protein product [Cladocopium goreaui]